MSAYTRMPHGSVYPLPDGRWRLLAPLRWEIGRKGSGADVVIPKGFMTDGPSVPAFARPIFRTGDARYAKASFLHDFMLEDGMNPVTAAAEFYVALRADGVPRWRAKAMWRAVMLHTTRDV